MADAEEIYAVPESVSAGAHIKGMHNYLSVWEKSVNDVDGTASLVVKRLELLCSQPL